MLYAPDRKLGSPLIFARSDTDIDTSSKLASNLATCRARFDTLTDQNDSNFLSLLTGNVTQSNPLFLTLPVSARDHIRGSSRTTVIVVKYGDFQCPHSAHAYVILKAIQQQVADLGLAFHHFPRSQIYPQAQRAAEAAEAADTQGQFWQMHGLLFERQHALANGHLVEYADYQSGVESGVNIHDCT